MRILYIVLLLLSVAWFLARWIQERDVVGFNFHRMVEELNVPMIAIVVMLALNLLPVLSVALLALTLAILISKIIKRRNITPSAVAVAFALVLVLTAPIGGGGGASVDRNDLVHLMGASHREVVNTLGQPLPGSLEGVVLEYSNRGGRVDLAIFFDGNGSVNSIALVSTGWTIMGLNTASSRARVDNVMRDFGATLEDSGALLTGERFASYTFTYRRNRYGLTINYRGGAVTTVMLGPR